MPFAMAMAMAMAMAIQLIIALNTALSIVTLPYRLTNNSRQLLSDFIFAGFIKRDAIVLIMG